MSKPIPLVKNSLERIAIGLVSVFLIGLPVAMFVLLAPHLFETWRRAIAPLTVAAALILMDVAASRAPASYLDQLTRRLSIRLLTSTAVGAVLGLLWGVVAGDVSLGNAAAMGVWFALFVRGLDELWRRRQRKHTNVSSGPASDV
jgi:hypothetical protein